MVESRHLALLAVVALVLAAGAVTARRAEPRAGGAEVAGARFRVGAAEARQAGAPVLPDEARRAGLAFAAGTAPADRQAVLAAVAAARPPARRLIEMADGLTDVRIGPTGDPGALGITSPSADGTRYDVVIDLARVTARHGPRGVERVVLHELGHVLDHALIPDGLMATLQRGIPAGWGCDQGTSGACAPPEERFAESFAKWATGDIGVDLYVGYKVPPPSPTLDAWGAPLSALAQG